MSALLQRPDLSVFERRAPMPIGAALALSVAVALMRWDERHRTRKALSELDDYLLRDIGLDRLTASREARRPFWRG